jgi:hypothetical protein
MSNPHRRYTEAEVFRGSEAVACGVLRRSDLRDPRYRRLFRDVYAAPGVRVTHDLRCRALALLAPPGTVLTGQSAATVRGVPLCLPDDPVEVVVPPGHALRTGGTRSRSTRLGPDEHVPWQGIRLATPARLAFDLLVHQPLSRAVATVDAVLHHGLLTHRALAASLGARAGPGVARAREALALVDARSESPRESQLRILLSRAGFPPVPQVEVRHRGQFVARVDLGYPQQQVAVEYDGSWHGTPEQQAHDEARLRRLHDAGWQVIRVSSLDPPTRDRLLDTVQRALAGRGAWPGGAALWTRL